MKKFIAIVVGAVLAVLAVIGIKKAARG